MQKLKQKMKQPSAYPLGGHADGCVLRQKFLLDYLGQ